MPKNKGELGKERCYIVGFKKYCHDWVNVAVKNVCDYLSRLSQHSVE